MRAKFTAAKKLLPKHGRESKGKLEKEKLEGVRLREVQRAHGCERGLKVGWAKAGKGGAQEGAERELAGSRQRDGRGRERGKGVRMISAFCVHSIYMRREFRTDTISFRLNTNDETKKTKRKMFAQSSSITVATAAHIETV